MKPVDDISQRLSGMFLKGPGQRDEPRPEFPGDLITPEFRQMFLELRPRVPAPADGRMGLAADPQPAWIKRLSSLPLG